MPARASDLPTSSERDALQKLRPGCELTLRALEPAGQRTLLNTLAKGWIERGSPSVTFRITSARDAAFRTKIR